MLLIGTRASALAMAQAEGVRRLAAALVPGGRVRLEAIRTLGDRLSAGGAKTSAGEAPQGLFTKELDEALLSGKIGAAVHSLKDVPTVPPPGIVIGLYLKREDPRDAFVSRDGRGLSEAPPGFRIGTSSPRREAQLRGLGRGFQVLPLVGNLDTRLRKLKAGEYDGIVLAAAGLKRLGLETEVAEYLETGTMIPAPGQGALCLAFRERDLESLECLRPLEDGPTRTCVTAERSFLRVLQGGCRVPVGAWAGRKDGELELFGVIARPDGKKSLKGSMRGPEDRPLELGESLAADFLKRGGKEILEDFGRTVR
jgi:hydroxymethylbilane synthase